MKKYIYFFPNLRSTTKNQPQNIMKHFLKGFGFYFLFIIIIDLVNTISKQELVFFNANNLEFNLLIPLAIVLFVVSWTTGYVFTKPTRY